MGAGLTEFRIGTFYPSSRTVHCRSTLAVQRNPDVLDAVNHVAYANAAEAAGLDYLFLGDLWGSMGPRSTELEFGDPMVFAPITAAMLFAVTDNIKVITTLHQAWLHPLVIARIGGNLDALSGGRWGMNAVSGVGFNRELLEGVTAVSDHDAFYALASESMEIVQQAWRNDGVVEFEGSYFRVKGRLVGPMPRQQPSPLIVAAGASKAGCEFAGRYASVAFLPGRADATLFADRRERITAAAQRAGRPDANIKLICHAGILIGETQEEAEALWADLRAAVDLRGTYEMVSSTTSTITTYQEIFEQHAEEQVRNQGITSGARPIHGGPEEIADAIQELREIDGCDGVSLSFLFWEPQQIQLFAEKVVPLLEHRGVWSPAYKRGWPW